MVWFMQLLIRKPKRKLKKTNRNNYNNFQVHKEKNENNNYNKPNLEACFSNFECFQDKPWEFDQKSYENILKFVNDHDLTHGENF